MRMYKVSDQLLTSNDYQPEKGAYINGAITAQSKKLRSHNHGLNKWVFYKLVLRVKAANVYMHIKLTLPLQRSHVPCSR